MENKSKENKKTDVCLKEQIHLMGDIARIIKCVIDFLEFVLN